MNRNKIIGLGIGATAALAVAMLGGMALANATDDDGAAAPWGRPQHGQMRGGPEMGEPGMGRHEHTPVDDATLQKIKAAVKKYDDSITVSEAVTDPDGSYDVRATKDDKQVMLEVSADLKTVSERAGGPGMPPGGQPGAGQPGDIGTSPDFDGDGQPDDTSSSAKS
ncbi:MAG: hypothetical protein V9G04_17380 [Nocardioides sp.]|jgi:hypothetical protein